MPTEPCSVLRARFERMTSLNECRLIYRTRRLNWFRLTRWYNILRPGGLGEVHSHWNRLIWLIAFSPFLVISAPSQALVHYSNLKGNRVQIALGRCVQHKHAHFLFRLWTTIIFLFCFHSFFSKFLDNSQLSSHRKKINANMPNSAVIIKYKFFLCAKCEN